MQAKSLGNAPAVVRQAATMACSKPPVNFGQAEDRFEGKAPAAKKPNSVGVLLGSAVLAALGFFGSTNGTDGSFGLQTAAAQTQPGGQDPTLPPPGGDTGGDTDKDDDYNKPPEQRRPWGQTKEDKKRQSEQKQNNGNHFGWNKGKARNGRGC